MTARFVTGLFLSSALVLGASGAAEAAPLVPMDHAGHVDGVRVACAGVGQESEANPRWTGYPVKFEFVGGYGQYLAHERIAVRDRQGRVVALRCHAPWVMMKLAPGRYRATATIAGGTTKHVRFTVPAHGERRIVLRYRDKTGGEPAAPGDQASVLMPSGVS